MEFSSDLFQKMPIIGIIRGLSKDAVSDAIRTFAEVGFTTVEVTMNTEGAANLIAEIKDHYNAKLNVGAGTVRSMAELEIALKAGASFVVTPIVNIEVIRECKQKKIPVFPGAFTPTEVYTAWEAGATAVKVFPTVTGGINHIKAIKGPLDHIPLIPTGGINSTNLSQFLNLGVYGVGAGSQLFPKNIIESGDWKKLEETMLSFKQSYEMWRSRNNQNL